VFFSAGVGYAHPTRIGYVAEQLEKTDESINNGGVIIVVVVIIVVIFDSAWVKAIARAAITPLTVMGFHAPAALGASATTSE